MPLELCNQCSDVSGLRENFGSLVDEYKIYLEDFIPHKDPNKIALGVIDFQNKRIGVRRDLIGQYTHVYVDKTYKFDNELVKIKGYIPVHLFDFTLYHEFQHATHPQEASERKIDQAALEDYISNYIKKNYLSSYSKNAERKLREYVV